MVLWRTAKSSRPPNGCRPPGTTLVSLHPAPHRLHPMPPPTPPSLRRSVLLALPLPLSLPCPSRPSRFALPYLASPAYDTGKIRAKYAEHLFVTSVITTAIAPSEQAFAEHLFAPTVPPRRRTLVRTPTRDTTVPQISPHYKPNNTRRLTRRCLYRTTKHLFV